MTSNPRNGKIPPMSHYIIADQDDDEEFWQYQRRRHITASDIFKFLPGDILIDLGWCVESWFGKDHEGNQHNMSWVRRDVLGRKRTGTELQFRDPVAVKWGQKEEDHNRELFGKYSGAMTEGSHALIKDDRWEYLAGSLDGYLALPAKWDAFEDVDVEMFDHPGQVVSALQSVNEGETVLLEMKQTSDWGISTWTKGKKKEPAHIAGMFRPQPASIPVYYQAQMQTQMAIRGIHKNIGCVKGGASHMTAHMLRMDIEWPKILDIVNDVVKEEMESIRKELDDDDK